MNDTNIIVLLFALYGAVALVSDTITKLTTPRSTDWAVWRRRMRWHWTRLKMDPEDAFAGQSDPPEWFQ